MTSFFLSASHTPLSTALAHKLHTPNELQTNASLLFEAFFWPIIQQVTKSSISITKDRDPGTLRGASPICCKQTKFHPDIQAHEL